MTWSSSTNLASTPLKSKRVDELAVGLVDRVGQFVLVDFGNDVEGGHGGLRVRWRDGRAARRNAVPWTAAAAFRGRRVAQARLRSIDLPVSHARKRTCARTPAYAAADCRRAARAVHHRAPRAGPARRADRHPLLRRLPLRHPPGARRVGRLDLPDGAGPRDRRPRRRRSARRSRSFKVGDTRGVGCFVDSCRDCAPCQRGRGAVLRAAA